MTVSQSKELVSKGEGVNKSDFKDYVLYRPLLVAIDAHFTTYCYSLFL